MREPHQQLRRPPPFDLGVDILSRTHSRPSTQKTNSFLISVNKSNTPSFHDGKHSKRPKPSQMPHKPVFRYKVSLGQFPKEAESYGFLKRQDHMTKEIKMVPEMVYPIQANRNRMVAGKPHEEANIIYVIPIPKHQILEDDWRAFRSVYLNYLALYRIQQNPFARTTEFLKMSEIVEDILRFLPRDPLTLLLQHDITTMSPNLSIYKDCVDPPSGYMYRRFKLGQKKHKRPQSLKQSKVPFHAPVVVLEGPFMSTADIPYGEKEKMNWDREMDYFDADVILGAPINRKVYIYNEPDAVPQAYARTNFNVPLEERVINIANTDQTMGNIDHGTVKVPLMPQPHGRLNIIMITMVPRLSV